MSLWTCLDCLTRFAVGISRCPHCNSDDYSEEELPKTTVSNGGSNARAELEPGYVAPVNEGDEQSSAGSSSTASSSRTDPNLSTAQSGNQSPAPMTENPSRKPRRKPADASSSADMTDGSTPETTSDPNADVNAAGGIDLPKIGAGS